MLKLTRNCYLLMAIMMQLQDYEGTCLPFFLKEEYFSFSMLL